MVKPFTLHQFVEEYIAELVNLIKKGSVRGSRSDKSLSAADMTFCFNIACYNIVRRREKALQFEGKVGRGGFTDLTIYPSHAAKNALIQIEHENGTAKAIAKAVKRLLSKGVDAEYRLLLTYYDTDKEPSAESIKKTFVELAKNQPKTYLLLGKDDCDKKNLFTLFDQKGKTLFEKSGE